MFKKLIAGSLAFISTAAMASLITPTFYVGPTAVLKTNTVSNNFTRELSPRLSLGYGGTVSQGIYIAGELFAIPNSIQINSTQKSGTPSLKSSFTYGLSILPGLMVSDATMVFLRFSGIKTHFTANNQSVLGYQLGAGLQTQLNASWDLRGEYAYSIYRTLQGMGAPRSDWFGVGAIYNFG
jgi:hypothetical protein